MRKYYRSLAKTSLILVYLVIIAGAVVRMTGSGMGCPDWPKCFGYYIPPTQEAELLWQPGRSFEKGQVIIREEALWVAKRDFTAGKDYEEDNWQAYEKHDYAIFNATHTWIEYINRLLGALAGLATLFLAFSSLGYWKMDKRITLLSWGVVIGMVFQAWLGATVVYSVLLPARITMHMVMALIIVAFLIYLLERSKEKRDPRPYDKTIHRLLWIALGLTMVQIVLGTQVRQFIDSQIDLLGENAKNLWLSDPRVSFYFHRSLSIAVVLLNGWIAYQIFAKKLGYGKIIGVLAIIGIEILTGIAMYYFDFPFGSQPLHLVLAALLFGLQFYLVLETRKPTTTRETSYL
ncbi:cytochrome c oxidase assembly protein subunit 15 [Muriicola jejuensis]|uniref:Heme A synthase n=1 Tax=Muriicola jejuensis TaxID=504488 RepID=A0A6P0UCI2_9FLAO|nr:COX15/CtaA family protein [Muriicola jejuensis]NER10747.1 heme A synthase [Muriicola jejuensis]SMP16498.1 cytochrome c oxidase assembly protein subunit 15 [Muriicola jejuensis]